MRKIFCAVLLVALMAASSSALEKRTIKLGILSKMNSTSEQFAQTWRHTYAPNNEYLEVIIKFYDSLTSMQMALNAGEIHEMVLPDFSAEYIMSINPALKSMLVLRSNEMGLAFGFREDSKDLRDKFNEALKALRENWTLEALEGIYIATPATDEIMPVKFAKFDNAEKIRVVVTGDLPPIDFIGADGVPAGFNTAVLAGIGQFLGMNIELVQVDAGARNATLFSGRADVVFWYEVDLSGKNQADVPEGVILSEPYYEWNKFIHVRQAEKKSSESSSFNWFSLSNFMNLYFH